MRNYVTHTQSYRKSQIQTQVCLTSLLLFFMAWEWFLSAPVSFWSQHIRRHTLANSGLWVQWCIFSTSEARLTVTCFVDSGNRLLPITNQALSQIICLNPSPYLPCPQNVLEMKWTESQVTEVILGLQVISSVTLEKSLFSGFNFLLWKGRNHSNFTARSRQEVHVHQEGCSSMFVAALHETLKTTCNDPWQFHEVAGLQVGPQWSLPPGIAPSVGLSYTEPGLSLLPIANSTRQNNGMPSLNLAYKKIAASILGSLSLSSLWKLPCCEQVP